MELKAVIVDDELNGAEALRELLLSVFPELEVREIATNAFDGIKAVKKHQPEVLFLDINMPRHSGFEVLEHIDRRDLFIVFTTAHEEYAINAIRNNAFDYLLKPIDADELDSCLKRIRNAVLFDRKVSENLDRNKAGSRSNLNIPVKEGILIIKQEKIVRIEGSGSYSYIFLEGGQKHIVSKSLGELETDLDEDYFFRCHNSHIIHLNKISRFIKTDGNFIEMEDRSKAEVSRSRKDELLQRLIR